MKTKTFKLQHTFRLTAIPLIEKKIEDAILAQYQVIKVNLEDYKDLPKKEVMSLLDLRERINDRLNLNVQYDCLEGSPLSEKLKEGALTKLLELVDAHNDEAVFEIIPSVSGLVHIDLDGAETLARLAHEALDQGKKKIFLNLRDVEFIGAAGMMTLLRLQNEIRKRPGGDFFILLPKNGLVYYMLLSNSLIEKFKIGFTD